LSPDPLVQLGLAETDAHASAVTTDGSGVKFAQGIYGPGLYRLGQEKIMKEKSSKQQATSP